MPADSDAAPDRGSPAARYSYRPLGVRMVGTVATIGILAVCAGAWIALGPSVRARFTFGQRTTLLAIGLAIVLIAYALIRARLVVDGDRVVVVNGYRRRELDRAQVVALRLRRGAPWAEMDLADGTSIPVMAIQGSDGSRASAAVRDVRRLLEH